MADHARRQQRAGHQRHPRLPPQRIATTLDRNPPESAATCTVRRSFAVNTLPAGTSLASTNTSARSLTADTVQVNPTAETSTALAPPHTQPRRRRRAPATGADCCCPDPPERAPGMPLPARFGGEEDKGVPTTHLAERKIAFSAARHPGGAASRGHAVTTACTSSTDNDRSADIAIPGTTPDSPAPRQETSQVTCTLTRNFPPGSENDARR